MNIDDYELMFNGVPTQVRLNNTLLFDRLYQEEKGKYQIYGKGYAERGIFGSSEYNNKVNGLVKTPFTCDELVLNQQYFLVYRIKNKLYSVGRLFGLGSDTSGYDVQVPNVIYKGTNIQKVVSHGSESLMVIDDGNLYITEIDFNEDFTIGGKPIDNTVWTLVDTNVIDVCGYYYGLTWLKEDGVYTMGSVQPNTPAFYQKYEPTKALDGTTYQNPQYLNSQLLIINNKENPNNWFVYGYAYRYVIDSNKYRFNGEQYNLFNTPYENVYTTAISTNKAVHLKYLNTSTKTLYIRGEDTLSYSTLDSNVSTYRQCGYGDLYYIKNNSIYDENKKLILGSSELEDKVIQDYYSYYYSNKKAETTFVAV